MNNRIKEIAEEAGITTNLDTDYFEKDMNKWVDYFSGKFAKLIVLECCKEIKSEPFNAGAESDWLKQYFGIEE